jgi:hypothetical protein
MPAGLCTADLAGAIAVLGADHPYVARWVEVQRAVFVACGADEGAAAELPPALAVDDPALAKLQAYDRAYQTASVAFYGGDRQGALAAFRKIANSASPHRAVATYMVAAIRAGSNGSGQFDSGDKPLVDEAQSIAEVGAILSDASLISVHPIAQELLGWIGANRADAATRDRRTRIGETGYRPGPPMHAIGSRASVPSSSTTARPSPEGIAGRTTMLSSRRSGRWLSPSI